ncbi:uncharacterized protein LOC124142431 [Haliotis rufescens]|uniref:uncharacterized protein LOC124142431 n=1 Tax=Haliotis rufescens TaxID=6454 RepID=UPI00201EDC94|nr:uncharacterized protein LOC124142431 [Haliotis rufescens]
MSSSDIVTCELFSNGLVCELLAGHDQNVQKVMKIADDTVALSNISLLSTLYGDLSWKTLWKMLYLAQSQDVTVDRCTMLSLLTDYLVNNSTFLTTNDVHDPKRLLTHLANSWITTIEHGKQDLSENSFTTLVKILDRCVGTLMSFNWHHELASCLNLAQALKPLNRRELSIDSYPCSPLPFPPFGRISPDKLRRIFEAGSEVLCLSKDVFELWRQRESKPANGMLMFHKFSQSDQRFNCSQAHHQFEQDTGLNTSNSQRKHVGNGKGLISCESKSEDQKGTSFSGKAATVITHSMSRKEPRMRTLDTYFKQNSLQSQSSGSRTHPSSLSLSLTLSQSDISQVNPCGSKEPTTDMSDTASTSMGQTSAPKSTKLPLQIDLMNFISNKHGPHKGHVKISSNKTNDISYPLRGQVTCYAENAKDTETMLEKRCPAL